MSFFKAGLVQAEKGLEWATKWHQTVVLWTIFGTGFVLTLGVLANIAGVPGFNFVLAAGALLLGIFFLTKPAFILSVFGLGSLSGLPDTKLGEILANGVGSLPNFEIMKFLGAGWDVVKATANQVAHVFLLLTTIFVVLGTFPISNPTLVIPAIVILTGVGLWTVLPGKGAYWYQRVIIAVLLVCGSVIFFKLYVPEEVAQPEAAKAATELLAQHEKQLDRNDATYIAKKGGFATAAAKGELTPEQERKLKFAANGTPIQRQVVSYIEERLGVIRIEYQVPSNIAPENLKPICGIPPGEYEFDLGGNPHLTLLVNDPESGASRTTINIGDWSKVGRGGVSYPEYIPGGMLLNDTPMTRVVVIGKDGCARVRFNWPENEIKYFRDRIFKIEETALRIILR
jgi:hypothetical protein